MKGCGRYAAVNGNSCIRSSCVGSRSIAQFASRTSARSPPSLVYRYNIKEAGDGLSGEEGTFNICTFWLVEALTRAGRHDRSRLEEARLIFERMLGFANHLGLYAEETGHRGEALGNFPQAFTHLALVSAAFNLDRALGPGR